MSFTVLNNDKLSHARSGLLKLPRIELQTPLFMPVCTSGTPKGLTMSTLDNIGYKMVVCNAYHLFLKPGSRFIKNNFKDLHNFSNWKNAILTDSGGFQIWSLDSLVKIQDDGALIKSHIDGKLNKITPEISIQIQEELNSDIMMIFDDCPKPNSEYSIILDSINRTSKWAKRSKNAKKSSNLLFGIVQGGIHKELRRLSAEQMVEINFDGYAIGGLGLGEGPQLTYEITEYLNDMLPYDKPRYSMGIGRPEDIIESISYGIDIFDCVVPTRNARNGTLFTFDGKINIKNTKYSNNNNPIDINCSCGACLNYSLGYLRHLYVNNEISAIQLMTEHNLNFYYEFIENIKISINNCNFTDYKNNFLERYLQK